jgi:hypothetical protein
MTHRRSKVAISKEETITSSRRFTTRATSAAVTTLPDATASTFQGGKMPTETFMCTWTPRIRSRARLASWSIVWMLFWGISFTPSSLGLGRKPERKAASDTGNPVWRVDLRSVGFTGFAPKQETWGLHFRPNPLCFIDGKVLVATFITREEVITLARRDQPGETLPLRLHAIFLDANAGKVQSTKEWSITHPRGGVIATGDGKFAVLAPAMIAIYSPSLEPVKDFKLSSEQQSHLWNFYSSPTGKSILVEYHYPEASFSWIDSGSLQPLPTWSDSMPGLSISDKELTISRETYVKSKGFLHEVLIRTVDGPWKTICRVLVGQGDSCGIPQFLSNEALALWGPHWVTVVPKTGGDALLRASFHNDEWLGRPLHPSADGKRFAVTVLAHKGGNAFFDIDSHSVLKRIVVYDLPSSQAVYTLDAKQQKIKNVSGSHLMVLCWPS